MNVKQISVFIENEPGKLEHFTRLLGENGIDLVSLSIADTTNFGILRGIVADYARAAEIIENAGYTICLTDVVVVAVPDRPGGLAEVLSLLGSAGISIEYLYSFVRSMGGNALIVFRVQDIEAAHRIYREHGIICLTQEDICNL